MADESAADDDALYSVWDTLTAAEVEAIFERLDVLARVLFRARVRGTGITPAMVAEARALRDNGALHLGHLPTIREVLA